MRNKGYTLIELIGALIILAAIILIVVPNVNKSLNSSRNRAYNVQIEEIKSAARSWSTYNIDNLPSEGSLIITLLQLKKAGLIDAYLKNPKTGKLFPDNMQIEIVKKGLSYVYNVLENTGDSNESFDPNGPVIILNGSTYMNVEVNTNFSIPSATYKDSNGDNVIVTDIVYQKEIDGVLNDPSTLNIIDNSELGKYVITYSATLNGVTNSIKRYVLVVDTMSPNIVIENYENNICKDIEITDSFALPIATITDNYNDILVDTQVIGNISNVPGVKKIIYKATDSSGNSNEFVLCVNMKDTTVPVINNIEITRSAGLNADIITVDADDLGVGLHRFAYSFDNGNTWQENNYFVVNDSSNKENIVVKVRDKIGTNSISQIVYSND